MKPDDAEFGITIDFRKGVDDPVRVFEAMTELLQGFKGIDRLFFHAVDPDFEPVLVLEDVEAASITSWVKNKIKAIDDQALKEFDVKQQIGKYAVKAKYRVIEYLDTLEKKQSLQRLQQLREDLYQLASEASPKSLPVPDHIPLEKLVVPLDQIQDAKRLLPPGNAVIARSDDSERRLNINSTARPSELLTVSVARTSQGAMEMVLLVRKPDYLGHSMWEFKHGTSPISAHINDQAWMDRFRAGKEIIVPGSSLACTVEYEYAYDQHGEVASVRHDVLRVHEVIQPPPNPRSLFD